MMIQAEFVEKVKATLKDDKSVLGVTIGGSWLANEIDEYSDVDLIIVTKEKVSDSKEKMLSYAKRFGTLLSAFTGEHVGEPRLLICLYDNPLLHVDIKFLTLEEVHPRIETPFILLDTDNLLKNVYTQSKAEYPHPDYQWIEDRFWVWIHYMLLKIGRGEFMETYDSFDFMRRVVFGPLLHIKNGKLPRGVRKVEFELSEADLNDLKSTLPCYNKESLFKTLRNAVTLYRKLRNTLYGNDINRQEVAEKSVMKYFDELEAKMIK